MTMAHKFQQVKDIFENLTASEEMGCASKTTGQAGVRHDLCKKSMSVLSNEQEGPDDLVPLANGEACALRFAVRSFYLLLQLQEYALNDFACVLAAGKGEPIRQGQLLDKLVGYGFAHADGHLDTSFKNVLQSSIWQIEPGHFELILPLRVSSDTRDKPLRDRWSQEVTKYIEKLSAQYLRPAVNEPDGLHR